MGWDLEGGGAYFRVGLHVVSEGLIIRISRYFNQHLTQLKHLKTSQQNQPKPVEDKMIPTEHNLSVEHVHTFSFSKKNFSFPPVPCQGTCKERERIFQEKLSLESHLTCIHVEATCSPQQSLLFHSMCSCKIPACVMHAFFSLYVQKTFFRTMCSP